MQDRTDEKKNTEGMKYAKQNPDKEILLAENNRKMEQY